MKCADSSRESRDPDSECIQVEGEGEETWSKVCVVGQSDLKSWFFAAGEEDRGGEQGVCRVAADYTHREPRPDARAHGYTHAHTETHTQRRTHTHTHTHTPHTVSYWHSAFSGHVSIFHLNEFSTNQVPPGQQCAKLFCACCREGDVSSAAVPEPDRGEPERTEQSSGGSQQCQGAPGARLYLYNPSATPCAPVHTHTKVTAHQNGSHVCLWLCSH